MIRNFAGHALIALFVFLLAAAPAAGALKAYLMVGDIEGDVTEGDYYGWSELLTYDISVQGSGWPAGHGTTLPSFSNMYVTKLTDRASPHFWKGVWSGEVFGAATIDVIDSATSQRYVQWLFQEVYLTAYSTVFDEQLAELVAIDFGKITYEYTPPGEGSISFIYNRETGMEALNGTMSSDFVLLTTFEATPAPEPTSALLAGIAALAWTVSRRARRITDTLHAWPIDERRAS